MKIATCFSLPWLATSIFRVRPTRRSFEDTKRTFMDPTERSFTDDFEGEVTRTNDRLQKRAKTSTEKSKDDVLLAQNGNMPERFKEAIKRADSALHSKKTMKDEDLAYAFDREHDQLDISKSCDEDGSIALNPRLMFQAPVEAMKRIFSAMWQGSDFRDAHETKFEDLDPETVNVLQSKDHMCSDGSPYWFTVIPATNSKTGKLETKKIAVEFMGSGSCYNARTCNLCPYGGTDKGLRARFQEVWERLDVTHNVTDELSYVFLGNNELPKVQDLLKFHPAQETFEHILAQRQCFDILPWVFNKFAWWADRTSPSFLFGRLFGIAPFSDETIKDVEHPLKDYTYVHVLHCTSDSHLGHGTAHYDGHAFHHHGVRNAKLVTDWIKTAFPKANRFYVHGSSAGAIGGQYHVQRMINEHPKAQFRVAFESGVFFPEMQSHSERGHHDDQALRHALGKAWQWKDSEIPECVTCYRSDLLWQRMLANFENPHRVRIAIIEAAFDPTHYWFNRALRLMSDSDIVDGDDYFRAKVKFYDQLMDLAQKHPQTFYGYVHHQQGHVLGRNMCALYVPPADGQMAYRTWWKAFINDELDDEDAFQLSFFQMDDPHKKATIQEILTGWLPKGMRLDSQMIRTVMNMVGKNQTVNANHLRLMVRANTTQNTKNTKKRELGPVGMSTKTSFGAMSLR
eukprot:gene727-135_t